MSEGWCCSAIQGLLDGIDHVDGIAAFWAYAMVGKNNLTAYLARLQQLRIVERRLPATIPPNRARISRRGRYHLSDAYFRFYFELLAPRPGEMPGDQEATLARIRANLRAFVGKTAFEQLALQWVRRKNANGALPLHADDTAETNWRVTPVFFARKGFTPAAKAEIDGAGGLAVDLAALDADLSG